MMNITTSRLVLTKNGPDNLESTYAYAGDRDNARLMVYLPFASLEETAAFLKKAAEEWEKPCPAFYEFAVLMNRVHVGGLTLYILGEDRQTAELAWIINPGYARQGIAFEAARGLIRYARQALGIRRFIAQCDSENTASRRLMEKLGMHFYSCTGGRFNRSSEEERQELTYELFSSEVTDE